MSGLHVIVKASTFAPFPFSSVFPVWWKFQDNFLIIYYFRSIDYLLRSLLRLHTRSVPSIPCQTPSSLPGHLSICAAESQQPIIDRRFQLPLDCILSACSSERASPQRRLMLHRPSQKLPLSPPARMSPSRSYPKKRRRKSLQTQDRSARQTRNETWKP